MSAPANGISITRQLAHDIVPDTGHALLEGGVAAVVGFLSWDSPKHALKPLESEAAQI
jgi:hypothetical protein